MGDWHLTCSFSHSVMEFKSGRTTAARQQEGLPRACRGDVLAGRPLTLRIVVLASRFARLEWASRRGPLGCDARKQ